MIPSSIVSSTSPTDILSYLTADFQLFDPDCPPSPIDAHAHLSQYISDLESSCAAAATAADYLCPLLALERALFLGLPSNPAALPDDLSPQQLALHLSHTDRAFFPPASAASSSSSSSSAAGTQSLLDDLSNLVLSLAVDRKVPLPPFDPSDSASSWFAHAIRTLADSQPGPAASTVADSPPLADLQFAHAYLTRQYLEQQNAQAQQAQMVAAHAQRAQRAEALLRETSQQLEYTAQQLVRSELALTQKTAAAHDLLMQNALLKVDALGTRAGAPSPPTTPSSLADLMSPQDSTLASPLDSPSVRILRMEFKKLVADLNAKFAHELEQLKQQQQQPSDAL